MGAGGRGACAMAGAASKVRMGRCPLFWYLGHWNVIWPFSLHLKQRPSVRRRCLSASVSLARVTLLPDGVGVGSVVVLLMRQLRFPMLLLPPFMAVEALHSSSKRSAQAYN